MRVAASKKEIAKPLISKKSSVGYSLEEFVEAEDQRAQREKERVKHDILKKIKMQEERNLHNQCIKERMDLHDEIMKKREK